MSAIWKHAEGESTEKVEKRDFRAVSNGYKPPQNLLPHSPFVIVFQHFRLYGSTYMILIVNAYLLTHLKHAEGMSLRYGVYVMVLLSLLNLLNCVRMAHIII